MPRPVWSQLVLLANAMRETSGVEVTPTEVAVIALEAGLAQILEEASE